MQLCPCDSIGDGDTPVHWTKDHLAVLVVAVFLVWLGSSVFVPIPYFPARSLLWGPGGGKLLGSTFLLALACFWTYVVASLRLPERGELGAA